MKTALRLLLVPTLAALAGGCEFRATTAEGTAGQKVEAAVERTQHELAEAGEKTQQALSEAGDKLKPRLEAAGDKLEAAAERITDAAGKVGTTVTSGERTAVEAKPAK